MLRSFWITNGLTWEFSATFFGSRLRISPPMHQQRINLFASKSKPHPFQHCVPRASADVKICALNEGSCKVFELLSDSEPEADDWDSDLEVMEALQNTSQSSSAIPLSDPEQGLSDNSDSAEIDACSESSDEDDTSELIEKLTVKHMEYRQGPAAIYPIFHTPNGTVIDLTHAHIINGMPVQGKIHNYPCPATRSIYVPKDLSIHKVLIVHNDTGHNHPMPALTKLLFGLKDTYWGCIKSYSILGATVAKIDNVQSTKMILDGKTPSAYAPPLHNKRVKCDMLHVENLEEYPNGLGIDAIYLMYKAEILTKPLPERYIHSYIEMKKGEIIILTFVPYLLKLLDDPGVTSFDGNTTYKGIVGKLNEWELTIFAKVVQCAASVVHAYITSVSADFFEILFDELQCIKREVTGKPLSIQEICSRH
ncbi:hypothetical protein B0H10DRAFT_2214458 [Mycena sp. CBHHK59/15]|nr:hypothetical protein B0H10DRAFT_2214458 [Mycena sp. CBHHK59/15]